MIFTQTNEGYASEILVRLKEAFPVHFLRVWVNYVYSPDPDRAAVLIRLANIREDQSHLTNAWDCRTQIHALVSYAPERSTYGLDYLSGNVARCPKGQEIKFKKRAGELESCVNYFMKQVEKASDCMALQVFSR